MLVGCMPQEMSEEEELARARVEKDKHPEQWHKPRKLTQAEATQQQRKWLEMDTDHLQKSNSILSKY